MKLDKWGKVMLRNPSVRKLLAIEILLIFLIVANIPSTAQYIQKQSQPTLKNHWLYVGGSGPNNYSIIQYAIDNASEGDTVFVYSGIYSDYFPNNMACVFIHKNINLIGEDKNTTIINGTGSQRVISVLYDTAGVKISGFTIQHGDNPKPSGWAPGIDPANHVRIDHNIIKNTQYGIFINQEYTDISIHDNTIIDNIYGIQAEFNSYSLLKIFNNTISNNTYGINSYSNNEVSIYNNHIINNSIGIHFEQGTSNNVISSNQISDNEIGIEIGRSKSTKIENNNFIRNNLHASISKITLISTMFLLPLYRQNWVENYWDDWNKTTPRSIQGFIILYIVILLPIKPFIIEVPIVRLPFLEFDCHPAQEPFDIPIGGD